MLARLLVCHFIDVKRKPFSPSVFTWAFRLRGAGWVRGEEEHGRGVR